MKTWIVGAVGIVALLVAITAMRSEPSSAAAGTLTTADYVEIRQLYNRYNHHIDNAKDDGYAYARLFTEDGVFETNIAVGTRTGHDELAALARQVGSSTKVNPAHIAFNIVIDPSPDGRLVKTAAGWRFKYRKYTPGGWEHPEEWAAH